MRKPNPDLHRQRILEITEAAAGCFLVRGFHQTSMQEIAGAAGVSMGLLYRYFANKDAIITAVAEQDRQEALDRIAALGAAADLRRALRAFMLVQVAKSRQPGYMALTAEILAESCRNPAIAALVREEDTVLHQALSQALDQALKQRMNRRLESANPSLLAHLIMALLDGLCWRVQQTADFDIEVALDQITLAGID
jgi:TetR/AcrR family transcriptional regulator, repressor for uid operon